MVPHIVSERELKKKKKRNKYKIRPIPAFESRHPTTCMLYCNYVLRLANNLESNLTEIANARVQPLVIKVRTFCLELNVQYFSTPIALSTIQDLFEMLN